jgi:hypothetical protein
MRPDEVARYHADRPGYELLDYAEVALPVYKVSLRVLLLQHTPLTPMYEFVLKAIRIGIDTLDEIAACLGIPAVMVKGTLEGLYSSEEIEIVRGNEGPEQFKLTRRGEKTTSSLERVRPEQQTIRLFFDGLTREPVDASAAILLSGREAQDLGMTEIPALPNSKIEVADIDLGAAGRILSKERTGEGKRDLLSIKEIERRQRLHTPAIAMVFQEVGGGEIELLFANETTMLDEHNRRFALAEGPRKTRLLAEFSKPAVTAQDSFSRKLQTLQRAIAPEPPSGRKRTLRAKAPAAEGTISAVTVHDHPLLLSDAIANARERVLIICPWITDQVVDRPALVSIEKMLKRGVRLYIGYGFEDDDRKKRRKVPEGLRKLADEFESFQLRDFGDTHEKVLIKDDEFVVEGSFNWLSFRGDPDRKLRRERSLKVTDPVFVEREFALFEGRFRTKTKKGSREGSDGSDGM